MSAVNFEIELKILQCYNCSIVFAIPATYHTNRHEDGKSFKCPNDHTLSFPGKGASKDELRGKIAKLEKEKISLRSKNQQYLSQIDRFETAFNAQKESGAIEEPDKLAQEIENLEKEQAARQSLESTRPGEETEA